MLVYLGHLLFISVTILLFLNVLNTFFLKSPLVNNSSRRKINAQITITYKSRIGIYCWLIRCHDCTQKTVLQKKMAENDVVPVLLPDRPNYGHFFPVLYFQRKNCNVSYKCSNSKERGYSFGFSLKAEEVYKDLPCCATALCCDLSRESCLMLYKMPFAHWANKSPLKKYLLSYKRFLSFCNCFS